MWSRRNVDFSHKLYFPDVIVVIKRFGRGHGILQRISVDVLNVRVFQPDVLLLAPSGDMGKKH